MPTNNNNNMRRKTVVNITIAHGGYTTNRQVVVYASLQSVLSIISRLEAALYEVHFRGFASSNSDFVDTGSDSQGK